MIESQLTRNGAGSDRAPNGEETAAPLSAHLCSDTSSLLDQLLRRYKQDEYEQLNQAEFKQFDRQIIETLEKHSSTIGSPLSLRLFHERISQVLESWQSPGDFINLAKQSWPRVVDARRAYEEELRANFIRYGQNAVRLLCMQTALTDRVLRSQVIERIVTEEIERACNSFNQDSPDFALSQKFRDWQSAIKDFAIRALGPA